MFGSKKNNSILLLGVFMVALLPRLILTFYSLDIPTRNTDGYEDLSRNLIEGKGFSINGKPTSFHEPLYPSFLAGIYYLFGYNFTAVRIIQGIMGAATCLFIFLISKMLFGQYVAVIASLIASFDPALVKVTQHTMSENLFIPLFIIAVFFLTRQIFKHDVKNIVFLGLALGLATLTRSILFLFPFFALLILKKGLVPGAYHFRKYVTNVIIFIAFFLLPIFPWTLRNWQVHHRFVPIATKTGMGLYSSYFPKDGKLYGFIADDYTVRKAGTLSSEADQSNFFIRETLRFIKNNPLRVLKLTLLKTAYFWSLFDWEIIGNGAYNFVYGFILPFFFYGLFITVKRAKELLPLYLAVAYYLLFAVLTYGSPRFRLSIEPYLIIIAAAGIAYFILRFSKRVYGIALTASYLMLNLLLYINSYQVKLMARYLLERMHLW